MSLLLSIACGIALTQQSAPTTVGTPPQTVTRTASIMHRGTKLSYQVMVGTIPLRGSEGEFEGWMGYTAYVKDPEDKNRPITFCYNGGPGSSTVWLHLGALGPKRAAMNDDGSMPAPPHRLVDNEDAWLDFTDLVFVDAMGTGFSRPARPELGRKFYGMRGDIQAFGDFIDGYLTRFGRFGSPLYLAGESYGGIRTAGLAGHLTNRGLALSGAVIVSGVMNYATLREGRGNDLVHVGFLPTLTATAYYHKALSPRLMRNWEATRKEVEAFARGEYAMALAAAGAIDDAMFNRVAKKLAEYTGLSEAFVRQSRLRVSPTRFRKELLRSKGLHVGRLDSRYTGTDEREVGDSPSFDASEAALTPVFNATLRDYLFRELGVSTDLQYRLNNYGGMGTWEYPQGTYADTSGDLREALVENPHMRVLMTCGLYDLACPFFALERSVDYMDLRPSERKRISFTYYPAGHMMYVEKGSREQLYRDVKAFYEGK